MNIGKNLYELRKKNAITQEALAFEMGVSVAAVSKWENDKALPDIIMLCQLADFYQVTTDELLGRTKKQEYIVCDDAPIILRCMKDILEKEGFHNTRTANKGTVLMEMIEEKMPYGIFLDIGLPDVNGLDILKEIKKEYPEVKVIMLTADDTEKSKNIAISYGADMYITKPFLPEHIQMALKTLTKSV
ncbi:MAG: response regulator [Lachnospiraceae bacterium]|nr:response regulator [Lachnospiraceae bacterium]